MRRSSALTGLMAAWVNRVGFSVSPGRTAMTAMTAMTATTAPQNRSLIAGEHGHPRDPHRDLERGHGPAARRLQRSILLPSLGSATAVSSPRAYPSRDVVGGCERSPRRSYARKCAASAPRRWVTPPDMASVCGLWLAGGQSRRGGCRRAGHFETKALRCAGFSSERAKQRLEKLSHRLSQAPPVAGRDTRL